mmetsp:Transcript_18546/g.33499  ORF Transcript_18546/g.33499 Transcript_18546/m.33499 type:complete len:201 (-) Transcript_18546:61-663(-)
MVEPEAIGYDLQKTVQMAEELVKHTIDTTLSENSTEYASLHVQTRDLASVVNRAWPRIPYEDAVKMIPGAINGQALSSESEAKLTNQLGSPVFVTHFPADITPFYMKKRGKETYNFDLLFPNVGEIVGGSEREENFDKIVASMKEQDRASLSWYSDLRKYGTVPHSGFGLGFERLLMFMSGQHNIRDVIPIPRTPGQLQC